MTTAELKALLGDMDGLTKEQRLHRLDAMILRRKKSLPVVVTDSNGKVLLNTLKTCVECGYQGEADEMVPIDESTSEWLCDEVICRELV